MKQAFFSVIRSFGLARRESVATLPAGLTELRVASLSQVAGGTNVDSPKSAW